MSAMSSCDKCPTDLVMQMIGNVAHCKFALGDYDEDLGLDEFCLKCPYGTSTLETGAVGIGSCVCNTKDSKLLLLAATTLTSNTKLDSEKECMCQTGYRQKAKNMCVECSETEISEDRSMLN
jgi:hypothetical protein